MSEDDYPLHESGSPGKRALARSEAQKLSLDARNIPHIFTIHETLFITRLQKQDHVFTKTGEEILIKKDIDVGGHYFLLGNLISSIKITQSTISLWKFLENFVQCCLLKFYLASPYMKTSPGRVGWKKLP